MAGQHDHPTIRKFFRELQRLGFIVEQKKNGFKIHPPVSMGGPVYHTHGTLKAYKALRAYYRKTYGIKVDS